MTMLVQARTRLDAWLSAVEALIDNGPMLNVVLSIESPTLEGAFGSSIHSLFDDFYRSEREPQDPLHTVAETIFPAWEYRHRGLRGVFESYEQSFQILHDADPKRWGTYAHRLVNRRDASGLRVNPLKQLIDKMRAEITSKGDGAYRACYELGIAEGAYDVPLYNTADDASRRRGGPCLSHLSFKLWEKSVHLAATYRSHDYAYKVPGNLLGLARLQACVAHEVGASIGTLAVHSTWAWIASNKSRLGKLIADIRTVRGEVRGDSETSDVGGPALPSPEPGSLAPQ